MVDFSTSLEGVLDRAKVCSEPVIKIRYDDFDSLVTALFPGTSYCITSTVEGTRDTYKTFYVDITTSCRRDLNEYLEAWSKNPDHFSPEPHDFFTYFLYRKLWEVDGKPIPKAMFLVEF